MTLTPMKLAFLQQLSPLSIDLYLAAAFLVIIALDLLAPKAQKQALAWVAVLLIAGGLVGTWLIDVSGVALSGAYVGDELGLFFKRLFLASGLLTGLMAVGYGAKHWAGRQIEYFALLMASLLGMSVLSGVRDLVLLLVAFELMGIPLYVMAGYTRDDRKSVEGAFKLLMTGAVSTATSMFGVSLLSGLAGTTSLAGIGAYAAHHPSGLVALGGTMAVAGMGFKIGVFPFHMWVPDTYEGTRTPTVTFLAVAPKAAGLLALTQILFAHDKVLLGVASSMLLILITATMVMGNVFALQQSNVKRLLAYSGVGHMGFLLMAMLAGAHADIGLAAMMFYLGGYLFTTVGAFAVVHAVAEAGGDDSIDSFNGLVQRSGFLGFAMLLFLLSLAGIPFVVGFWAKLYVFMAAWKAGMSSLVVLGAVISVVGLFYYLRVARAMFMKPAPVGAAPIEPKGMTTLVLSICLVFVLGMGMQPRPFIEAAQDAAAKYMAGKPMVQLAAAEGR